MNEDAKRAFDALHALAEQAWRDWDHKSRHEWRLSFAVWAALLAASAARLQTSIPIPIWAVGVTGGVVLFFHALFLRWIQQTLTAFRNDYHHFRSRMPPPVTPPAPSERPKWWKSPSVHTQLAITSLLAVILIVVSAYAPPTAKEATASTDERGLTASAADGSRSTCAK